MTDLHLHRCTVHVVRRGGWSWGPDPRRLVDGVIARLRELLEARVAALDLAPDAPDVILDAPLRLRVPITLAELTAAARPDAPPLTLTPPPWLTAATAALDAALAEALPHARSAPRNAPATPPTRAAADSPPPPPIAPTPAPSTPPGDALRRLLHGVHRTGELGVFLNATPPALLARWHRALAPAPAAAAPLDPAALTAAAAALTAAFARPLPPSAPRARRLARWLYALTVLETSAAPRLSPAALAAALVPFAIADLDDDPGAPLDAPHPSPHRPASAAPAPSEAERDAPRPPSATAAAPAASPVPAPAPLDAPAAPPATRSPTAPPTRAPAPPHRAPAAATTPAPALHGERRIDCALPYLLLPPLARMGWLDAIAAAAHAAHHPDAPAALALGLAFAVLDPPERGWRRPPAARLAAATFAALPDDEAPLTALDRDANLLLGPARLLLARALVRGHDPARGLVLRRAATGLWLFEADGLFPLAIAPDWPALAAATGPLPPTRVAIPLDAFDPACAAAIATDGHTWITDAPPTRGERPRPLSRGRHRLWTNDRAGPATRLHAIGQAMPEAAAYADDVIDHLAARPPLPRAPDATLSLALTHAAGVALAALAHQLYRERETPTPVLALRRFADLSARVTTTADEVTVTLPLGARSRHLREAGLLGPIDDVPWLGGRRLILGSG